MATGAHMLAQQKANVEARIRSLVNNDLKEICKTYGAQVSGTKAVLQSRCMHVLNGIVAKGDQREMDVFKYRLANHGTAPPSEYQHPSSGGYQGSNMAARNVPKPTHLSSAILNFKQSPFYRFVETVNRPTDMPEGKEMPQNRHTVTVQVKLSDEQLRKIKENPNLRVMLYCGQYMGGINPYTALDVTFPNQIEVKVNSDDVKANFKGLKNKPGSTKPADITDKLRKTPGYPNLLNICYALTTKRFQFVVQIMEHVSADELTKNIKRVIPKERVLIEMNQANADPDIAATSSKMSLKDPVAICRITIPVRATVCMHNQCFDLSVFMQLQEQAPTWQCPICSKSVSFESLSVDKYFEEILNTTSKSVEQVTIEPNGDWSVDKEDEDKGKSNHAKGEPRAAYDDDFDDEIVEVMEPPKETNGFGKKDWLSRPAAINTPPLSAASREASIVSAQHPPSGNKRAANPVIDLTLSDDDEPPRPAKRLHTTGNPVHRTNSYSTPSSLPDPPRFQAYTTQPAESAAAGFRAPSAVGQGHQHSAPPPARSNTFHGSASASASGAQSPALLSPFASGNSRALPPISPGHRSGFDTPVFAGFSGAQPHQNFGGSGAHNQHQQHSAQHDQDHQTHIGLSLPLGRPAQQRRPSQQALDYGARNGGHNGGHFVQDEGDGFGNWRAGSDFDYGQYSSPS